MNLPFSSTSLIPLAPPSFVRFNSACCLLVNVITIGGFSKSTSPGFSFLSCPPTTSCFDSPIVFLALTFALIRRQGSDGRSARSFTRQAFLLLPTCRWSQGSHHSTALSATRIHSHRPASAQRQR